MINTAKHYSKNCDVSFPGALLKASLIPTELLDRYINMRSKILDLGCGEGMFSHSMARLFPTSEIYGIDLDVKKIQQAKECKLNNVTFQQGDAEQFSFKNADAVIFNDMLHHNSYIKQEALINHAKNLLKDEGLIIIKEVNSQDKADKFLTTFFDSRLYPSDQLNFRNIDEWRDLLEKNNFEIMTTDVMKHPWIASRTVFVARKTIKQMCIFQGEKENSLINYHKGRLNVFLTGGSGFIGYHMAKYLIENGLNGRHVNLFLLARNPIKLDRVYKEKAIIIQSDLLSLKNVNMESILKDIDYVFHFAAEVKLHGDPEVLVRNNVEGTQYLLEVFKNKNLKRFIHASTMGAVDRQHDDPCLEPMNEETPPHPLSVYGKTKLNSELLVKNSGIPYSIVRIPWAFGDHMTADTHIRNLLERIIHHSLTTRIDFPGKVSIIAVEDLVRAFNLVATHPKSLNDVFFVAGYPPISLGSLFQKMSTILVGQYRKGIRIPFFIKFIASKIRRILPLTIQSLFSDVLCVDFSKIKKLGFQPEQDLNTSLIRLSAWIHRQHNPKRKIHIVTGAASGIGLNLTKKLIATGRDVIMVDKNEDQLIKIANLLNIPYLNLDLTLPKDLEHLLNLIMNMQDLYGFINCAGIGKRDSLIKMTSEKIDEIIAVNISAVVKLSKCVLEVFDKQGEGVLLNISSSAALQPLPYFSLYAASKAFLSSFTESISFENKFNRNIRIFNVIPSGTDTDFQVTAGVQKNPKEKLLSPEYVADKIAALIEGNNSSGTYFIGNRGRMMSLMSRILPKKLNIKIWGYLVQKTR